MKEDKMPSEHPMACRRATLRELLQDDAKQYVNSAAELNRLADEVIRLSDAAQETLVSIVLKARMR